MGRGRIVAITACFVLWALCCAGYGGYLMLERGLMGWTSCPLAEGSSEYGEATWSWLPPGVTCTWRGVSSNGSGEYVLVQSPPPSRAVLGAVLLAWGGTLAVVAWASRPASSESGDWRTEFDPRPDRRQ